MSDQTLAVGTAPETGSTGVVDTPVTTNPQSLNPRHHIEESGSTETIKQLLYDNWIAVHTQTWSTENGPGSILWSCPIHPSACNWPNKHISQMFMAWIGSVKTRFRIVATAFYGGSIRVGVVPPYVKREQLPDLGIEMLTTYPNMDYDPKDTSWQTYMPPDCCRMQFHTPMEFDQNNPDSFGGWIVIFVAGRLVTQDPARNHVDIMIEMAGNFEYRIPRKIQDGPRIDGGPLRDLEDITSLSLCENKANGNIVTIDVFPKTDGKLKTGFFCARAKGGYTIDLPTAEVLELTRDYARKLMDGVLKPSLFLLGHIIAGVEEYKDDSETSACPLSLMKAGGKVRFHAFAHAGQSTPDVSECYIKYIYIFKDENRRVRFALDPHPNPNIVTVVPNYNPAYHLPDNANSIVDSENFLRIPRSDECAVVFTDQHLCVVSCQTVPHGYDIFNWQIPEGLTALYQLIDMSSNSEPTPVCYLRLWPGGYFTTKATNVHIQYPPARYDLKFIQTLSQNTPIPGPTPVMVAAQMTRMMKALGK